MSAIACHNVSKVYGDDHWAVQNVDLHIPEQSIFALVGPNGAGKSSTIKMMATLMEPTAGRIFIQGKDIVGDRTETRKNIGYLPDHFSLYEEMTVARCLDFYGSCYAMSPRDRARRIGELLDVLNLSSKRDAKIQDLSRGMKQRVGIARAILHDPPVLLLDEPASGLDPAARISLREALITLKEMGKTILISSHILTELNTFCTAIAIIQQGKILEYGDIESVQARLGKGRLPYTLTFFQGIEIAKAKLEAIPDVSDLEQIDNRLRFKFASDESLAADLLAQLVGAGAMVIGMDRGEKDLEWVYQSISADTVN